MKAKLTTRRNPLKPQEAAKYYAQPVYDGTIDIDVIAKRIAGRSSLTAGDIKNVLSNFLEELPNYMLLGRSVKLNELGTFRISFSSEGVVKPEDFKASMIKDVKIIYTPDSALKTAIQNGISYEVDRTVHIATEE